MKITKEMLKQAILDSHDDCSEEECLFQEMENLPKTVKKDVGESLYIALKAMVELYSNDLKRESFIHLENCVAISEMWAESPMFRQVLYAIFDNGLHVGFKLRQIHDQNQKEVDELTRIAAEEKVATATE